ncbi:MAG: hypothetical protein IKK82_04465 [Kiritimatiellae bacterium]|nr:hypothetical protein [Kiritimatiellia bacterium]MBR6734152.1 hypothetical protein [Kiritimatiellia bacterium]
MKSILILLGAIVVAVAAYFFIAPREQRIAMLDRVATIGELSGGEKTPRIVREQQRKERIRQDNTWTPENRALHPIEYCQAQLEKLSENASRLDVQAHKYAVAKNQAQRVIADSEAQLSDIAQFLKEAKSAYREADAAGKWPVTIRGFALSKEKAQEKIVAAAEKRPTLQSAIARNRVLLATLEKKAVRVVEEQKKIIKTKERIQIVLNDLNLKKVVEGDDSITDVLNAINDSLGALGTNYEDPSIDDMLVPDKSSTIKVSFDAIMAE